MDFQHLPTLTNEELRSMERNCTDLMTARLLYEHRRMKEQRAILKTPFEFTQAGSSAGRLSSLNSNLPADEKETWRVNNLSFAYRALQEWHEKFNVPFLQQPGIPSDERRRLRFELIKEEFEEVATAMGLDLDTVHYLPLSNKNADLVRIADGLADLLYVIYGCALEFGIPLDACFEEVHRSNMTKLWPDGTAHYREDGKVLKPDTYTKADLVKVLLLNSDLDGITTQRDYAEAKGWYWQGNAGEIGPFETKAIAEEQGPKQTAEMIQDYGSDDLNARTETL
jgi:predicted HAD superfamily Cof-like phosphohydrolase